MCVVYVRIRKLIDTSIRFIGLAQKIITSVDIVAQCIKNRLNISTL